MKKFNAWNWKNVRLPERVLEGLVRSFELDLYSAFLKHEPDNLEILVEVGNLFTRLGKFKEGLKVDERLVKIKPKEALFHYNLACSQSLLGQIDHAIESLKRAIALGYRNFDYLVKDADLENARKDQRFQEVLKSVVQTKKRPQQEVQ
ncbi:MAG: hypothetical protein HY717_11450 [Planctomycetes bacterium]|nr:hypothetical protein [Planctomycetota bacterium]